MAILKKIFRYPIKGLSGESLNEILLEKDQVLSGDREYAFARSHVSFDEKNPVYLRKTNFLALVKDEKLAKLSTEFNSKSKRLIIKVDKKTVLDEIIVNEINIFEINRYLLPCVLFSISLTNITERAINTETAPTYTKIWTTPINSALNKKYILAKLNMEKAKKIADL